MMRTLNLRHVQNLTAQDLALYTQGQHGDDNNQDDDDDHKNHVQSLWIGPEFGGSSNSELSSLSPSPSSSLVDLMEHIPAQLIQLDLDLTLIHQQHQLQHQQEEMANDNHNNTDNWMTDIMSVLLRRLRRLQTLSLRCQGAAAAVGFSKALAMNPCAAVSFLSVLDFRGNNMGIDGVTALAQALTTNSSRTLTLPNLKQLILSWNSLTDDSVQALVPYLQTPGQQLQCLDLSCNPNLTDTCLNQHLLKALTAPHCALQRIVLFSCPQIQTLCPRLVQVLCHENFCLQQLNLQGSGYFNNNNKKNLHGGGDSVEDEWEQIQFAFRLNGADRQRVLRLPQQPAMFANQSHNDTECRKVLDDKDCCGSRNNKKHVQEHLLRGGTAWWTLQTQDHHHHDDKRPRLSTNNNATTTTSEHLLQVFSQHNQADGGREELSVLYYFCRETVHVWSHPYQ